MSCHKCIEAVYLHFFWSKISEDKFQAGGGFHRGIKQVVLRSSVRTVVVVPQQVLGQHFFLDRTMTYITSFDIKRAQGH